MTPEDEDERRDRDRRDNPQGKRRGAAVNAGAAAKALMRELGLTEIDIDSLPERLPEPPPPRALTEAELVQRRLVQLPALGWPLRALRCAIEPQATPAIAAFDGWDVSDRSVLILSGHKGTGKTVAASWWAMRDRHHARFITAANLARAGRFNGELQELLDAEALCLDDLGVEYGDEKGAFIATLDELIDKFYRDMKPLIITTNATAKEFEKRIGGRAWDRMRECAKWKAIAGGTLRSSR